MGLAGKLIYNSRRTIITPGDIRKTQNKKLTNTSDTPRFYFFASPLFTANKPISIRVDVRTLQGETCTIALADRSLSLGQGLEPNQLTYLSETKKIHFVVFSVPANSEVLIERVQIGRVEEQNGLLAKRATGDYLIITDAYPNETNHSDPHFLHARVSAFLSEGLLVDVVEVNHGFTSKTVVRNYRGTNVLSTSFNSLRTLLQKKHYKKIVLANFSNRIIQIIDATDISTTQLIFLATPDMVLYNHYDEMYRPYFTRGVEVDAVTKRDLEARNEALAKYSQLDNAVWVFPSKVLLQQAEELHNVSFSNSQIAHPVYPVAQHEPLARTGTPIRICIVKPFSNYQRFAVDIDVRTILNLSKKPYFPDLVINVYGYGDEGDFIALTEPLRQFPNVRLHRHQPDQTELETIYRENDILLAADRFDANSLTTYQATLTGIVPVLSPTAREILEYIPGDFSQITASSIDAVDHAAVVDRLVTGRINLADTSRSIQHAAQATYRKNHANEEVSELLTSAFVPAPLTFKPVLPDPILTVVIPSYNVEPFLRNCVFSLINQSNAHKLEVLIVNDGSKDRTAAIAKELEELSETKNGPIVRLIDKENGGHGSTINAGITEARGKYFRLLDGDDYFITKNFEAFIDILERENSDIVLTDLVEDYAISATKIFKNYYGSIQPAQTNDLDIMNFAGYGFGEWGPLLSTTTCKTQLLKDAHFTIDEHCFYVDMEYNFMIYSMAKNVTYYPLTIYNYYLGRIGQSMSKESMMKNVLHHEKVTLRLIKELNDRRSSISEQKQAYIIRKLIIPLCKVQYYITTEYFNEKKHFVSFDRKLKHYPEFYDNPEIAGNIIKLHRLAAGNTVFTDSALKKLKRLAGR